MEEPIQYMQFLLCLFLFNWNTFASGSSSDHDDVNDKAEFKIEGKVYFGSKDKEWTINTRVLVDGGNYLGFVKTDGSFVVHGIPSGSYVVEVANPDALFETVRVEITSKGKMRARRVNLLQPNLVKTVVYPLEFRERGKLNYFHKREQWRLTDFLFNPMVLTMIVPLLLIMVLPKLMNAADADTQKDVQGRRPYSREANFSVARKSVSPDSSVHHGSDLLKLSQKPRRESKCAAISCELKHQNVKKESQDKKQSKSMNAGKQRGVHSSKKLTTLLDYSWKTFEKNEGNSDTSNQKNVFYVKIDNEPSSGFCLKKSAKTHLDVHVDLKTKEHSPLELKNLVKYKPGELPLSPCRANLDLSVELACNSDKVKSHEDEIFMQMNFHNNRNQHMNDEHQEHDNINQNMNDELQDRQSQVDKEHEQKRTVQKSAVSESSLKPSPTGQTAPESSKAGALSSSLASQSKDGEQTPVSTDSELTKTDESITLTDKSMLNFSLSDESLPAMEERDFSSANSPTLERSSVPHLNVSSGISVTPNSELHEEQLVVINSRNDNKVTLPVTSHASSSGSEKDHKCAGVVITDSTARTLEKQS